MFHPDDPLRGKYLKAYEQQLLAEVEEAQARQSRQKADNEKRGKTSPNDVPVKDDQRTVNLAARLAPEN